MTELREKMLRFIRDFTSQNGYPPSVREIMRFFEFKSPRAISFHLEKLEAEGYLECDGKARGIRMMKFMPDMAIEIPIYGIISAGYPDHQTQESLGRLVIRPGLIAPGVASHAYGLRVKGDSMIGAKIFDGDVAVVEFRTPRNNDIVVALIDGENTLKRFVQVGQTVSLKAENPKYPDLIPSDELKIQGVVVGVYRSMQ
ncbi:MAG: repressor LexA [Verrucomicrobiae bacterium]|nr:repressor LexA [Verrucomicrobiae bacterium]